jgi:hypothetical protein
MIVDIIRIEQGLVTYRNTFPGGPAAFFADVTQVTFVVKNIIYTMQTMIGDGIVVRTIFICPIATFLTYEMSLRAKDLSMLRRLAICVDYYCTESVVVRYHRLGHNRVQGVVHLMLHQSVWLYCSLQYFTGN